MRERVSPVSALEPAKRERHAGTRRAAAFGPNRNGKATLSGPSWNFANISVNEIQSAAPVKKSEESRLRDDQLPPGLKREGKPDAAPASKGTATPAAPTPTLTASNDTYTDTAAKSKKDIRFDVTIPSGSTSGDYALVNWKKGFMKDGSGKFFRVIMYGATVDSNYADWKVDSVDADPVYWSDTSGRWNYRSTATGFYATDSPGPALTSEHGAEYALQFKMGLYKLADVPTTTTGTISATPLATVPWQYSVKVSSTGTFTHPAL